jgi:hypothetical protein
MSILIKKYKIYIYFLKKKEEKKNKKQKRKGGHAPIPVATGGGRGLLRG